MSNVKSFIRKYKNILKLQNEIKKNHQQLVGLNVKVSPKYRQWLKSNIDGLTDYKGDELLEDIINKKVSVGKVVFSRVVDQEVNLTIEFTDGRKKIVGLEDIIQL